MPGGPKKGYPPGKGKLLRGLDQLPQRPEDIFRAASWAHASAVYSILPLTSPNGSKANTNTAEKTWLLLDTHISTDMEEDDSPEPFL